MEKTWREKLEGTTEQILAQIKKLIDEGNIRKVVVKQRGRLTTVRVVATPERPPSKADAASLYEIVSAETYE